MNHNKFDSLLAFLYVVDNATKADLKKKNDKLAKVSATVTVILHSGLFLLWCSVLITSVL